VIGSTQNGARFTHLYILSRIIPEVGDAETYILALPRLDERSPV